VVNQSIVFVWLCLFLTPHLLRLGIIIDYTIDYQTYVNELCVNQDKPELACDGKCALASAYQKTEEPQAPGIPIFSFKEIPAIEHIFQFIWRIDFSVIELFNSDVLPTICQGNPGDVFHPPTRLF